MFDKSNKVEGCSYDKCSCDLDHTEDYVPECQSCGSIHHLEGSDKCVGSVPTPREKSCPYCGEVGAVIGLHNCYSGGNAKARPYSEYSSFRHSTTLHNLHEPVKQQADPSLAVNPETKRENSALNTETTALNTETTEQIPSEVKIEGLDTLNGLLTRILDTLEAIEIQGRR